MKQVKLYNHNKTTYENITRIFETSNKCATVQPTGSGKSFLIFKLAQDNSDKTIIVFEPNKQIIGRVSEQMKEYGIDNIKFYTYQKLNSQHKRDEISIDNADYICLDELHRIKAKQWEQAVIAIQEKFFNAKVLGLTATPERMDGQNIIDYFGAELACNITLGDAIVNKILPCPTYISALYTFDEEIQRVNNKINESRNSDEEKNDMRAELEVARKQLENALGVPAILKKHIPDSNGKYIVFCQNVEHLNTMKPIIVEWFTQAGFNVHMYEVHTKNPNHKIKYNEFKTDNSDCIKLCLCVDMFNEGVHLEGISGVILLRPTQSNIIYFQQIGRAISASDENVPIIFDLVNNGNCLAGGSLKTEIEIAVERQREEISECGSECDMEVFDIGNFHIYDYIKDSLDILSGIENKCIDTFSFAVHYIKEYIDNTKSSYIPFGYVCDNGFKLGRYVNKLKEKNKSNALPKEKVKILLNLGIDLNRYTLKEKWIEYYMLCKEYENHYNQIIIATTKYKNISIGMWLFRQNAKMTKGLLSQKQIELLQNLMSFNNTLTNRWFMMYDLCLEYYDKHKMIPHNTVYKNQHIGDWFNRAKQNYYSNKLSNEQSDKLFVLLNCQTSDVYKWNYMFQLCNEYYKQNGYIYAKTIYKNENIGNWLLAQRKLCKKGSLTQERIEKLNMISGLSTKRQIDFERDIAIIKKCIDNNIIITKKTVIDNNLIGCKICKWRKSYKNGTLTDSEERYQQLLSLGIDLAKEGSLM